MQNAELWLIFDYSRKPSSYYTSVFHKHPPEIYTIVIPFILKNYKPVIKLSININLMEFLTPTGGKNLLNSAFCTLHSAF